MKRATGPGKVEELSAPPGRHDLVQGLAKAPLFAAATLYGSGSDFDGTLRATKSASFLFLRSNLVKVDLSYNPLLELLQELLEGGS